MADIPYHLLQAWPDLHLVMPRIWARLRRRGEQSVVDSAEVFAALAAQRARPLDIGSAFESLLASGALSDAEELLGFFDEMERIDGDRQEDDERDPADSSVIDGLRRRLKTVRREQVTRIEEQALLLERRAARCAGGAERELLTFARQEAARSFSAAMEWLGEAAQVVEDLERRQWVLIKGTIEEEHSENAQVIDAVRGGDLDLVLTLVRGPSEARASVASILPPWPQVATWSGLRDLLQIARGELESVGANARRAEFLLPLLEAWEAIEALVTAKTADPIQSAAQALIRFAEQVESLLGVTSEPASQVYIYREALWTTIRGLHAPGALALPPAGGEAIIAVGLPEEREYIDGGDEDEALSPSMPDDDFISVRTPPEEALTLFLRGQYPGWPVERAVEFPLEWIPSIVELETHAPGSRAINLARMIGLRLRSGRALRSQEHHWVHGRSQVVLELIEALDSTGGMGRVPSLIGPPGSGRTAVLGELARRWRSLSAGGQVSRFTDTSELDRFLAAIDDGGSPGDRLIVLDQLDGPGWGPGDVPKAIRRVEGLLQHHPLWQSVAALTPLTAARLGYDGVRLDVMDASDQRLMIRVFCDRLGLRFGERGRPRPALLERLVYLAGDRPALLVHFLAALMRASGAVDERLPGTGRLLFVKDGTFDVARSDEIFRSAAHDLLLGPLTAQPGLQLLLSAVVVAQLEGTTGEASPPVPLADIADVLGLAGVRIGSSPVDDRAHTDAAPPHLAGLVESLDLLVDMGLLVRAGGAQTRIQWALPRNGLGQFLVRALGDPWHALEAAASKWQGISGGSLSELLL